MNQGSEFELSVVIPIHNESGNIEPLCRELREVLAGLGRSFEVLAVDDGSTDGSRAELLERKRSFPELRVILLPSRQGQSAALAAGFRFASGRLLVTMDGDLQTDPGDIPRLLEVLDGPSLAIGDRRPRRDSAGKRVQARLANRIRSLVLGDRIRDIGCPLRAFRRSDLAGICPFDGFHRFLPVLLQARGIAVRQVRVNHRPRLRGRSRYGMLDRAVRAFIDLWAVRWLIRRTILDDAEEAF